MVSPHKAQPTLRPYRENTSTMGAQPDFSSLLSPNLGAACELYLSVSSALGPCQLKLPKFIANPSFGQLTQSSEGAEAIQREYKYYGRPARFFFFAVTQPGRYL